MISEPMEFCRDIECSGVRSLENQQDAVSRARYHIHWRAIVRTEEPHALLGDLRQLEQRDHLKAVPVNMPFVQSKRELLTHRYLHQSAP